MNICKRIKAKRCKAPLVINDYWPYYRKSFEEKMQQLGLEVGAFAEYKIGAISSLLRNGKYEFIYRIIGSHRLQGSDFIPGTDREYELQLIDVIKRRK